MDEQEVFVFLSPEVEEFLLNNRVDLVTLLNRDGLPVTRRVSEDPATLPGSATKEPATVILASAALVAALTPAIIRVIEALADRGVQATNVVLDNRTDSSEKVSRDSAGQPPAWRPREQTTEGSIEAGLRGVKVSFKFGSKR